MTWIKTSDRYPTDEDTDSEGHVWLYCAPLMKIKVTREDIDNGMPGDPERCALALALRAHYSDVRVRHDCVQIRGLHFDLSPSLRRFIKRFDEWAIPHWAIKPRRKRRGPRPRAFTFTL